MDNVRYNPQPIACEDYDCETQACISIAFGPNVIFVCGEHAKSVAREIWQIQVADII